MAITGEARRRNRYGWVFAVVDIVAGMQLTQGVLAALLDRERTGSRPLGRGLADGRRGVHPDEPRLGPPDDGRADSRGSATSTRPSHRTRRCRWPTARSPSQSARTGSSRASSANSGWPSSPTTSASPPTGRGSSTVRSCGHCWTRCCARAHRAEWLEVLPGRRDYRSHPSTRSRTCSLTRSPRAHVVGEVDGVAQIRGPLRIDGHAPADAPATAPTG